MLGGGVYSERTTCSSSPIYFVAVMSSEFCEAVKSHSLHTVSLCNWYKPSQIPVRLEATFDSKAMKCKRSLLSCFCPQFCSLMSCLHHFLQTLNTNISRNFTQYMALGTTKHFYFFFATFISSSFFTSDVHLKCKCITDHYCLTHEEAVCAQRVCQISVAVFVKALPIISTSMANGHLLSN